MRMVLTIYILLWMTAIAFPQETLRDLPFNPLLMHDKTPAQKTSKGTSLLTLPFFDDFSINSVHAADTLWEDRHVHIDRNYPIFPISVGVATFDALNETGHLHFQASTDLFAADTLTSRPINTTTDTAGRNLSEADMVYLSFYYQPGGGYGQHWKDFGNAPETDDSLLLQFSAYPPNTVVDRAHKEYSYRTIHDGDTTYYRSRERLYDGLQFLALDSFDIAEEIYTVPRWRTVWSATGMTLDEFYAAKGSYFAPVFVKLDSSIYFHQNFQFRFINFASLYSGIESGWRAGNVDQWHLDYIYLNANRHENDTNYTDFALVAFQPSVVENYLTIPWAHYQQIQSATTKSFSFTFSNLSNTTRNVNRRLDIFDGKGKSLIGVQLGSTNMPGNTTTTLSSNLELTFDSNHPDSAEFLIQATIKGDPDFTRSNDTIKYYQQFHNYYAYDDGTPEKGFGLKGDNSMVAYRFTNLIGDTLRGLKYYFNPTLGEQNRKEIFLTVWDDAGGKPGNILYQSGETAPFFLNELFRYHTYITENVYIPAGDFYVGWYQQDDVYMNIGLDRHYDNGDKIFTRISTLEWENSGLVRGSLMIRPVLGSPIPTALTEHLLPATTYSIFPNPVRGGTFSVRPNAGDDRQASVTLYDTFGRLVLVKPRLADIDVSQLSSGLYLVVVSDPQAGHATAGKLIIDR